MLQIIFINVLVYFACGSSNARRIAISDSARTSFTDKIVVDIIRRCFVSESTDTVGFIGKSISNFTTYMRFSSSIATVLIDDPETARKGVDDRSAEFPHGLSVFVMSESEEYKAEQLFLGLQKTRWWNHEAFFIILNKRTSTVKFSCIETARELLLISWKMDILSSIFLCANDTYDGRESNSVFVYTYNPFKETAPMPWIKVETRSGPKGHPWTLFQQVYDSEKTTCDSMKFSNKTSDLNGFVISANVKPYPPYLTFDFGGKRVDDLRGTQAHVLKAIWRNLNASISMITYDTKTSYGDSFENGSAIGMIVDLVYGKCDININVRYIRKQWGVRFSSAQSIGGLLIVTNHRGWKSPLTKIINFISIELLLVVLFICFVIVLITGYSTSRSKLPDLMNVLRLFFSTGMYHLPISILQRLLLFTTMLMVLIINSLFQGKLSGLLTSRTSSEQIETINDIDRFGYEIYGFRYLTQLIPLHLLTKFHYSGIYYLGFCSDILANHSNAACIAQSSDIPILMTKQNLYISKEKIIHFYESHTIRKNWPLYDRFNRLTERLVDSGLISYWEFNETAKFQKMNRIINEQAFRALNYRDLEFSFKIVAIGLAISTATFIIEYCIAYQRYVVDFKPYQYVE